MLKIIEDSDLNYQVDKGFQVVKINQGEDGNYVVTAKSVTDNHYSDGFIKSEVYTITTYFLKLHKHDLIIYNSKLEETNLSTMDLNEVLDGNFSSILGTWESVENTIGNRATSLFTLKGKIKISENEGFTADYKLIDYEYKDGYLEMVYIPREKSEGPGFTAYFVPFGVAGPIEDTQISIYQDRLITLGGSGGSTHIRQSTVNNDSTEIMNVEELSHRDFSSISGEWVLPEQSYDKYNRFRIDDSGLLYWDDDTEGIPINDVTIVDDYGVGILSSEYTDLATAPTRLQIFFFPRKTIPSSDGYSDISKDRIALGGSTKYHQDPDLFYRVND